MDCRITFLEVLIVVILIIILAVVLSSSNRNSIKDLCLSAGYARVEYSDYCIKRTNGTDYIIHVDSLK